MLLDRVQLGHSKKNFRYLEIIPYPNRGHQSGGRSPGSVTKFWNNLNVQNRLKRISTKHAMSLRLIDEYEKLAGMRVSQSFSYQPK